MNKQMVSASLDGNVKLWDFFRRELVRTMNFEYPIENLVYNRMNDLIAFTQSDLSVHILNARTGLKKVRSFTQAAKNKLTDVCFSQPDSKYLVCTSLDKSLRIYDLLTGCLVDWI